MFLNSDGTLMLKKHLDELLKGGDHKWWRN